jgi:4-amino-4-deoxy-L-arabinose transferase-like glycosyltransferase
MVASHARMLSLPYFWDEAGQFVPQALDLLRDGSWIAHSTVPNIHPPLLAAMVAAVWKIAGCTPWVTRFTMLLFASAGLAAAFLLAKELLGAARPAVLAVSLLFVSPLFFAQSLLVQLDAPAMVLTTVALLLFLWERLWLSAAACVALVLMKETGVVVPLVLGAWLAAERRWRDALLFTAPGLALLAWVAVLWRQSGFWAGNRAFLDYNLYYPLEPVHLALAAARRLYFLCFADLRWLGWVAVLYGWRKRHLFHSRKWRIALLVSVAQVALVTLLGGAVLERYLLPVFPAIYAVIAGGIQALPRVPGSAVAAALLAGLLINNFVNPPYPFPYENNLAFVDFVKLQQAAADYLESRHLRQGVFTVWPLSLELARPELGFVSRPIIAAKLPGFTPEELRSLDWNRVQVLVAYSRDWDPPWNLIELPPIRKFWQQCCGYVPAPERDRLRARIPLPVRERLSLHGQWMDIYVKPAPDAGAPIYGRAAGADGERRTGRL